MLEVKTNTIQLRMDDNNLKFSFGKGDTEWNWTSEYRPKMECKEGTVYFDEALEIHHELVQNGIGKGIRSSFAGFEIEGKKVPYAFETYAWIEECTEDIFFEWIPICEEGLAVEKLFWPGELELEEKRKDWYTLLNMQQGVMIPNDWETELKDIPFDGFFETAGGYMPWFAQFKGGNGYIAICTTPWNGEVLRTFGNTLKYVVVTVPVGLFLSILIAALLNSKIKGTSIYRTLYFLPSVTMAAAVAMVWKWIYNEKMGILNSAIRALGGKGIGWLTDPKIALYSVMIVGLWMSVGYNMIILLAGMQGISKSYYEAAQIDGAGPIQLFFKVTIPLLTPTIFFVMITSIISGFQVFDVIYMMIGKTNPAYANTQTVVMLFYRQAFDYGYKGYAAAISILIFAVIMLVTVIQMIGQKKWVNYD